MSKWNHRSDRRANATATAPIQSAVSDSSPMRKAIGLEGHTTLAEQRPRLENDGLWLAVEVQNGYVKEDGLCYGLPVDHGSYSLVVVQKAVGELADKTCALIRGLGRKPDDIFFPRYLSFREVRGWDAALPPLPDGAESHYANWSTERQQRYKAVHDLHGVAERCQPTIEFHGNALYRDADNSYYARMIGQHYDAVVPVNFVKGANLALLQRDIATYLAEMAAYKARVRTVNENLQLLAEGLQQP